MSPSLGIDALGRAVEQWNAQNLDGYLKLYREDVVLHGYSGMEPGFVGVRKFYRALWSAFPGAKLVIEDVFASDDKVTCRFVLLGVHTGNFHGIPPTGAASRCRESRSSDSWATNASSGGVKRTSCPCFNSSEPLRPGRLSD